MSMLKYSSCKQLEVYLKYFLLGTTLLLSTSVYACETLSGCLSEASTITGQHYVVKDTLKDKLQEPLPSLDKENADFIISHLLNMYGYARIKIKDDMWKIISARDIRYHALPLVNSSKENAPSLDFTEDYKMLKYKASHPDSVRSLSRSLRPFLSRYGRIVDIDHSGIIIVQDTSSNLKRLYQLITEADHELSSKQVESLEKNEAMEKKLKLIKARACDKNT